MEPNQIPTTETPARNFFSMPMIIALFVLLFLLVLFMYGRINSTKTENDPVVTQDKTIVYGGNLKSANSQERLPAGFPTDIPVETDSLEQSLKTEYPEKGLTQYSVTYTTAKSIEEVQTSYNSYFSKDGYEITSKVENPVQIYASKNGDDVSVVIETNSAGKTRVFVVFLDR
jgi:nitric oxide reductase large subunit